MPKGKSFPRERGRIDRYDTAIAYLIKHPNEILKAWSDPTTHEAGCLFLRVAPIEHQSHLSYGCLTQVHFGNERAFTPELTQAIKADKRIPPSIDITPEHLPIFAEWQRRIDQELNRKWTS